MCCFFDCNIDYWQLFRTTKAVRWGKSWHPRSCLNICFFSRPKSDSPYRWLCFFVSLVFNRRVWLIFFHLLFDIQRITTEFNLDFFSLQFTRQMRKSLCENFYMKWKQSSDQGCQNRNSFYKRWRRNSREELLLVKRMKNRQNVATTPTNSFYFITVIVLCFLKYCSSFIETTMAISKWALTMLD